MESPQLLDIIDLEAYLEDPQHYASSPSGILNFGDHHLIVTQVLDEGGVIDESRPGAMTSATVVKTSAKCKAVEDESLQVVREKKERRKEQKRDYAKRKRTKEKLVVVALMEREKQLKADKDKLKEQIKQLTANLAVFQVFMPLHKDNGCKISNPQDLKPTLTATGADSTHMQTDVLSEGSSCFPDGLSMSNDQEHHSAQDDLDTQGNLDTQSDLVAEDIPDSFDMFSYLGFETGKTTTLNRSRKSSPGEDYSDFSGDIFSFDFTNRAPIPPSQDENAASATSPVATSPTDTQFWIS